MGWGGETDVRGTEGVVGARRAGYGLYGITDAIGIPCATGMTEPRTRGDEADGDVGQRRTYPCLLV